MKIYKSANLHICIMIDAVFPKNNELQFIRMAEKLKYDSLCFLYEKDFDEKKKKVELLQKKTLLKLYIGAVDSQKRTNLFFHCSNEKDRDFFEKHPADIVFGLEKREKDYMHSRDSGLNQVLLALAEHNDIIISFSFSLVLQTEGIERARILGRIMQNIKWCGKYGVKTSIASYAKEPLEMRSYNDLISFFCVLGMDAKKAKHSIAQIEEKIGRASSKAQGIPEGIELPA
jgi:RNase P/RNase MRP subunit p30